MAVRYHSIRFSDAGRFDLTYIGADGEKHRPMIHQVIFGSIEIHRDINRAFAGAFPTWIAQYRLSYVHN